MVHECPWWELQLLQLRFLLCEFIDCSKWQRCKWRLEMGCREVFTHADCPSVMRPWMKRGITDTPDEFTIYLHDENAVGDLFCSSQVSFCIPMALLFSRLQTGPSPTPKPVSTNKVRLRSKTLIQPIPKMTEQNLSASLPTISATQIGCSVSNSISSNSKSLTAVTASKPGTASKKYPAAHGRPIVPALPTTPNPDTRRDSIELACLAPGNDKSDNVCTIL